MDNEELDGVKFSEFPSQTPGNSDEVVGLHSGGNARFSIANIVAAVRQGLASIFVPLTRTINGKGLSTDISLDSSDIDYDNTASGLTATDVQEAIDELAQGGGGGGSAADITYDPTTSGLSATDVQDAIDEVVTDLGDKQDEITASGILKGGGQGGVSAATAGTDYQAPLTAGTDYATPAQLEGKANQAQLSYVETGTTASQNYTAGQYISLNGLLYTADTAIASGATFYTSGGNKNLTECVGGGFNKLKNELDYEDISQYFYIQQSSGQDRCSISKLVARKYKDGRVTIYATGTILVTLSSTQWTIMRIRSQAGVSHSEYVAGTATYNFLPCFSRIDNSTEPYVELAHSGTSPGKPFMLFLEYWI